MAITRSAFLMTAVIAAFPLPVSVGAAPFGEAKVRALADAAIGPVMRDYGVPGMAVGVITPEGNYAFHYGVASKETARPVAADTLFEIGSVSKTFTATLAAYGAETGRLSLSDSATKHLPDLRGSALDKVTLQDLGTHMSGGMPLQVPDGIANDKEMTAWFRDWKPAYAPGTVRTYSNVSIGLFGMAVAGAMGEDFAKLMEGRVLPGLGLEHTWLAVPKAEEANYAEGYTKKGAPTRMSPGVLASEAYRIKTTVGDLSRFVALNMGMAQPQDPALARALTATHTGYARFGAITQDLVWEQYAWPAPLADLLAGNSDKLASEPNEAAPIDPPLAPRRDVLLNKTGSTNGFAAYVAYLPERRIGVVLMANRNYPIPARVKAAYAILTGLDGRTGG